MCVSRGCPSLAKAQVGAPQSVQLPSSGRVCLARDPQERRQGGGGAPSTRAAPLLRVSGPWPLPPALNTRRRGPRRRVSKQTRPSRPRPPSEGGRRPWGPRAPPGRHHRTPHRVLTQASQAAPSPGRFVPRGRQRSGPHGGARKPTLCGSRPARARHVPPWKHACEPAWPQIRANTNSGIVHWQVFEGALEAALHLPAWPGQGRGSTLQARWVGGCVGRTAAREPRPCALAFVRVHGRCRVRSWPALVLDRN